MYYSPSCFVVKRKEGKKKEGLNYVPSKKKSKRKIAWTEIIPGERSFKNFILLLPILPDPVAQEASLDGRPHVGAGRFGMCGHFGGIGRRRRTGIGWDDDGCWGQIATGLSTGHVEGRAVEYREHSAVWWCRDQGQGWL